MSSIVGVYKFVYECKTKKYVISIKFEVVLFYYNDIFLILDVIKWIWDVKTLDNFLLKFILSFYWVLYYFNNMLSFKWGSNNM